MGRDFRYALIGDPWLGGWGGALLTRNKAPYVSGWGRILIKFWLFGADCHRVPFGFLD